MCLDTLSDPLNFYSPEEHLFPKLQRHFASTGKLDPLGFYVILDWKASRAKTRHLKRLRERGGGDFCAAVAELGDQLSSAGTPKDRLGILITEWGFRLPTATAILSVLYPDDFTVYDVRVIQELGCFAGLSELVWSDHLWDAYVDFKRAVRDAAPGQSTYRECDRWLWGKSKGKDLSAQVWLRSSRARPA